ncbi:MAG TPA: DUF692 domain-containing protein [Burkholderiaceae bacterium]|nr:DUF692 domain-containing protein [Burkholderiaceae bacterium]
MQRQVIPQGAGIGLRFAHHEAVVATRPRVPWFEVHSENYLGGGTNLRVLEAVRKDYPIALHGVGMSLGSAQGIDVAHLERVGALIERIEPCLVSEHLSWSVVDGHYLADLLPLPLTEETLERLCRNVDQAQSRLGRQILLENPSSYLRYRHSSVPEWEFLASVVQRTGCGILCDVNNVFVSACNHGWNAAAYLAALPAHAIGEIHLAGHSCRRLKDDRVIRIDDHGGAVAPEVWRLYEDTLARVGAVPTLIEWDNNIPALDVLLEEAARAQVLLDALGTDDRQPLAA